MAVVNFIAIPDGMSWEDWRDTFVGANPSVGSRLDRDATWANFATDLSQVIAQTPRPEGFSLWEPWAMALKDALNF
jgi:hypothetical protein